jgi:hypothetical protein
MWSSIESIVLNCAALLRLPPAKVTLIFTTVAWIMAGKNYVYCFMLSLTLRRKSMSCRCFSYTCLKRLMTFWTIVAMGRSHSVFFTGTPPQMLQLNLLNAPIKEKVVVRVYFPGPLRLQVFVGGVFKEDLNLKSGQYKSQLVRDGRWAPNGNGGYLEQGVAADCACQLAGQCVSASVDSTKCDGRSDIHGANTFDRASSLLSIVIGGHDPSSSVKIQTVPVVQVCTLSRSKCMQKCWAIELY